MQRLSKHLCFVLNVVYMGNNSEKPECTSVCILWFCFYRNAFDLLTNTLLYTTCTAVFQDVCVFITDCHKGWI